MEVVVPSEVEVVGSDVQLEAVGLEEAVDGPSDVLADLWRLASLFHLGHLDYDHPFDAPSIFGVVRSQVLEGDKISLSPCFVTFGVNIRVTNRFFHKSDPHYQNTVPCALPPPELREKVP